MCRTLTPQEQADLAALAALPDHANRMASITGTSASVSRRQAEFRTLSSSATCHRRHRSAALPNDENRGSCDPALIGDHGVIRYRLVGASGFPLSMED
jgi:hypothetical protein